MRLLPRDPLDRLGFYTCDTCKQGSPVAFCTNKQCSRHGRNNDYLKGEPAAPSLDGARLQQLVVGACTLLAIERREDARTDRERAAHGNPSPEAIARFRADAEQADREADTLYRFAEALPSLLRAQEERDELAEALSEAAREIPCAGPVAHRIRVQRQEWSEALTAAHARITLLEQQLGAIQRQVTENPTP